MTMKLKESDLVEQSSTIESNNDCNDGNSSVHSLHSNLLLESNLSVLLKYKVVAELGEGSMGTVSKVRLRNRRITPSNGGGSGSGRASPSGGASVNSNGSNGAAAAPPPSPPSVGGYFQGLKVFRTATLKQNYKTHFYAMKQIKMNQLSDVFKEEIKNEIAILRSLDHPNIVRIFEIYHYDQNVDVICELCDGGDLYARFPYNQKEAAKITSKLLSAVKYMHDHNVVHRDLKFENIMFEDKSKDAEIKGTPRALFCFVAFFFLAGPASELRKQKPCKPLIELLGAVAAAAGGGDFSLNVSLLVPLVLPTHAPNTLDKFAW